MEKHQHDDALEDYVRRTFDDYEADTPNDMWDRVEQSLEKDDRQWPVFIIWKRWLAAALFAGTCLLAGWALGVWYGHSDVPSELTTVSHPEAKDHGKPETIPMSAPELPTVSPAANEASPFSFSPLTSGNEAFIFEHQSLNTNASTSTHIPQSIHHAPSSRLNNSSPSWAKLTTTLSHTIGVNRPIPAEMALEGVEPDILPLSTPTISTSFQKDLPPLSLTTLPPGNVVSIRSLHRPVSADLLPVTGNPTTDERHTCAKANWYVGPFIAVHRVRERNTSELLHSRRFVSRQVTAPISVEAGIRAGAYNTVGIGWETGISYQTISRSTLHNARLRHRDGVIHPVNPGNNRYYNFNYSLSSYQGNSEMTLSMEETDTVTVALPDEPLMVRIAATELTKLLRVPLVFTARTTFGRFSISGKAGVTAQLVVKNSVEITDQRVFLGRFRTLPNQPVVIQSREQRRLIPGYQAGIGLQYALGQHVKASLEAVTEGDFTLHDDAGNKLPAFVDHGVRAGIIWEF